MVLGGGEDVDLLKKGQSHDGTPLSLTCSTNPPFSYLLQLSLPAPGTPPTGPWVEGRVMGP